MLRFGTVFDGFGAVFNRFGTTFGAVFDRFGAEFVFGTVSNCFFGCFDHLVAVIQHMHRDTQGFLLITLSKEFFQDLAMLPNQQVTTTTTTENKPKRKQTKTKTDQNENEPKTKSESNKAPKRSILLGFELPVPIEVKC